LIAQNKDQKGIFPNFADVMKQYEGRLVGILGTLIIHLIGGIVFMTIKLSSLYNENRSEFVIEFENDRDYIEEELIEVPLTLEKLFENDDRFLDIVRNIANDDVADVDPMELQDRVKEEMIASGLLGEDNYIDDRRNTVDEMAAMYQGPTRIYYYLENRYKIEMPVPIYKCENSGKIVFNIVVNQRGRISDYSFDETASSRSDACLLEAAISSIKRTRFNPDSKSPKKQAGSITYEFMKQ
jgi:hypothetical protein